ncbi:cytochrome P450 [Phascolomyces articulosus]|uniref:Cytochrome P450 n=1 Tax=Phascolomyces articulosus TaxID=60185 RepID=A0AAD5P857_9FUNG|nr:cytochrome P450 [Phascolomyces articulosus]
MTSQQLSVSSFNNLLITLLRNSSIYLPQSIPAIAIITAGAAIILTTGASWRYILSRKQTYFSTIPTPKGSLPLVGHLFSLGRNRVETFHQWHKELGSIFYFRLGVKKMLVVADPWAAHELLATMGKITSNRPKTTSRPMFGDVRGIIFAQPHEMTWSILRKSALNALGPRKLKEASPILNKEADEFVELVATGVNIVPLPLLMRSSLNFIFLTVFSVRTTSIEDPIYKTAISIINTSMKFSDFKNLASQFIPLLRIFDPIIGIKKKIIAYHKSMTIPFYIELIERALDAEEKNMVKILNDKLNHGKRGYYDNLIATIHDMAVAGTDTTAVTMAWSFLQLSTKLEVQMKIQHEIDTFVNNNGRLPNFWERNEMPYLIATQRECMRLRPTTEFGVIHASAEDFEWHGSVIPKDTWIMTNMADIHSDTEKYPEPEQFIPERFLGREESMTASANRKTEDRDQFNFGWGRRVCIGSHLAETQMFNVWVRVLHRCIIRPALDKNGNEVPQSLQTVPPEAGPIVVSPSKFELRFVPRNSV